MVLHINLLVLTQGDQCSARRWVGALGKPLTPTALGAMLSAMVPWLGLGSSEVRNLAQVNFVYSAEELWPLVTRAPNRHKAVESVAYPGGSWGSPVGYFRLFFNEI